MCTVEVLAIPDSRAADQSNLAFFRKHGAEPQPKIDPILSVVCIDRVLTLFEDSLPNQTRRVQEQ